MGVCPYGYGRTTMTDATVFSVGDAVALLDGRVGRILYVNGDGTYEVHLPEDPVADATRGHAALRPDVAQPPADLPTTHVSADQLRPA
jgi:hypothetical protein